MNIFIWWEFLEPIIVEKVLEKCWCLFGKPTKSWWHLQDKSPHNTTYFGGVVSFLVINVEWILWHHEQQRVLKANEKYMHYWATPQKQCIQSTTYRCNTASVPWWSLCMPSRMAILPSSAAITSGENCQVVSPLGEVTRCCTKSREVMSWGNNVQFSLISCTCACIQHLLISCTTVSHVVKQKFI